MTDPTSPTSPASPTLAPPAPPAGSKTGRGWLWIAGGVTVGAALFLSPLASEAPDGLDHSAGPLGLQETAPPHAAPAPEYLLPGVRSTYWARGLAGGLGVAAVFLTMTGLVKLLARRTQP